MSSTSTTRRVRRRRSAPTRSASQAPPDASERAVARPRFSLSRGSHGAGRCPVACVRPGEDRRWPTRRALSSRARTGRHDRRRAPPRTASASSTIWRARRASPSVEKRPSALGLGRSTPTSPRLRLVWRLSAAAREPLLPGDDRGRAASSMPRSPRGRGCGFPPGSQPDPLARPRGIVPRRAHRLLALAVRAWRDRERHASP